MGKYNNGIMGPFSGRVGTVVGSTWKGRFVMRQRPRYQSSRSFTPAQLARQERFSLVSKFAKRVVPLINFGYKHDASLANLTTKNVAISAIDKVAVQQVGDVVTFLPNLAPVSQGLYRNVAGFTASASATSVTISWTNNAGVTAGYLTDNTVIYAKDNDPVMIGVYNETKDDFVLVGGDPRRDDASASQNIVGMGWEVGDKLNVYYYTIDTLVWDLLNNPSTLTDNHRAKADKIFQQDFGMSQSACAVVTIA